MHVTEFCNTLKADLKPERAWVIIERMMDLNPSPYTQVPYLALVLERTSPDLSWSRIASWVSHEKREIRIKAAQILIHWKKDRPEKSQPLLDRLLVDADPDIATLARMEPPVTLLPDEFLEDEPSSEPKSESKPDEIAIKILPEETPSSDIVIKILGPDKVEG